MSELRAYFGIVGAFCFAGAIWLFVQRLRVLIFGSVALGKVIAHRVGEFEDSNFYLPVVAFCDHKGVEFQFASVAGGASRRPSIGVEVLVRYLPSNPRIAYVGNFLHMWAAPLAMMVLGAAGISALWIQ